MTHPDLNIRLARPDEIPSARSLYRGWGYGGGILEGNSVLVAESGVEIVGLVRRTVEAGTMMLRGMQVAPGERGSGVGTALLREFVERWGERVCYCVPYTSTVVRASGKWRRARPPF